MDKHIETEVKELVSDFKLDEALDLLIVQAQAQTQRKQNTLLVLKGKLAMLEEQRLAGILDPGEVSRQKAEIAHQILDIADGSSLDFEVPAPQPTQDFVQKTVTAPPSGGGSLVKYLLLGSLLVVAILAVVFIARNGGTQSEQNEPPQQLQPNDAVSNDTAKAEGSDATPAQNTKPDSDEIMLLDFPNYRKKFNLMDFQYEFQEVSVEAYSDTETKLIIRYSLNCRSNIGVCYRIIPRVLADDHPIGPSYQSSSFSWLKKDTTITDELNFVLPNNAKSYLFELSRDGSTWKRPFKILSN